MALTITHPFVYGAGPTKVSGANWDATHSLSGALTVANGGTGLATLTASALYVGNGTSAPSALAVGATGAYLRGATGADPIWSTLILPNSATAGDLVYATGANTWGGLGIVAAGQVLVSGAAPAWSASPTLTKVLVGDGSAGAVSLGRSADGTTGLYFVNGAMIATSSSTPVVSFTYNTAGLQTVATGLFNWSSTGSAIDSPDTALSRVAAGIVGVTSGLAIGTTPATAGHLRLPTGFTALMRNAANSANYNVIASSQLTTNDVFIGDTANSVQIVLAQNVAIGISASTAGHLRFPSGFTLQARNVASSANLTVLSTNASDQVLLGGTTGITVTAGAAGPHAIGGAPVAGRYINITGSFTGFGGAPTHGISLDTTLTGVSGQDTYGMLINPTIVEAASGVHSLLSGLFVNTPTVTPDVATVTNTASVYIGGAMSATVTGANYAMWIASGGVRMGAFGAGTATFDASGNLSSVSDARLKEQVRDYAYGLDAVRRLRPIMHRWNKLSGLDRDHDYVSFLAQEVEAVLGETAVGHDEHGYLTLQERAIIGATVRAIQELADRLDRIEGVH